MPETKADAESGSTRTSRARSRRSATRSTGCKGDKIQFTNWQGTYTIDFVRGADGDNPALAWQVNA